MRGGGSRGYARDQIGTSLDYIRDAIEREDPWAAANQVNLLLAICSPYLGTTQDVKNRLISHSDDDDETALTMHVIEVLTKLLSDLSKHDTYAWTRPPLGDAGHMSLGDDDDPQEAPA